MLPLRYNKLKALIYAGRHRAVATRNVFIQIEALEIHFKESSKVDTVFFTLQLRDLFPDQVYLPRRVLRGPLCLSRSFSRNGLAMLKYHQVRVLLRRERKAGEKPELMG